MIFRTSLLIDNTLARKLAHFIRVFLKSDFAADIAIQHSILIQSQKKVPKYVAEIQWQPKFYDIIAADKKLKHHDNTC